MDKSTKLLGTEPIGRLLWTFSLPAVLAMFVDVVYIVADRMFVARTVGADGIAAIAVVGPMFSLMIAIQLFLQIGGGSLFSIKLGEKDGKGAQRVFSNTFLLQLILAGVFVVFGWVFAEPIMLMTGASPAVLPLAKTYLRLILLASIFNIVGNGLNGFIFRLGHPKRATFNTAAGAALNILLSYLFVLVFDWGMFGAGVATLIAMALTCTLVFAFLLSPKCTIKLALPRPDLALMALIGKLGLSPFMLHLSFVLSGFVTNNMLVQYGGDWALAGFGIMHSIILFCILPAFGITGAMQTIAGYNFGAKNWGRLRSVLRLTLIAVTGWLVLFVVATSVWRAEVMALFGGYYSGAETLDFAVWAFSVHAPVLPLMATTFVANSYLLSIGSYGRALALNMSRQMVFMIPLMIILPRFFGMPGFIYSIPIADVLGAGVAAVLLVYEWRKLNSVLRASSGGRKNISAGNR